MAEIEQDTEVSIRVSIEVTVTVKARRHFMQIRGSPVQVGWVPVELQGLPELSPEKLLAAVKNYANWEGEDAFRQACDESVGERWNPETGLYEKGG